MKARPGDHRLSHLSTKNPRGRVVEPVWDAHQSGSHWHALVGCATTNCHSRETRQRPVIWRWSMLVKDWGRTLSRPAIHSCTAYRC